MIAEYWPAIVFLSAIASIATTVLVAAWLYSRGGSRPLIRR